jgi:hypothetical protein
VPYRLEYREERRPYLKSPAQSIFVFFDGLVIVGLLQQLVQLLLYMILFKYILFLCFGLVSGFGSRLNPDLE